MGTAQFWIKYVIKVSRLIGGGKIGDVTAEIEKFVADVSNVAPAMEPELESNRAGLCVTAYVRLANMGEVNAVLQKFKDNGWRVK